MESLSDKKVRIIVKCSDNYNETHWYQSDVTSFVTKLLRRLGGGGGGGRPSRKLRHCHAFGTCNSAVFKEVTLPELTPCNENEEVIEVPPIFARMATVPTNTTKVYCVGGHKDIRGYIPIMRERIGIPLRPRDVSYNLYETRKDNVSHNFVECDFGQDDSVSVEFSFGAPLVSPRYCPHVVSIRDRIYLFGGNCPPFLEQERSPPFAEVFDTTTGISSPLPEMPYPRIGAGNMIVAPLIDNNGEEEKILIMSRASSPHPTAGIVAAYDIMSESWKRWDDPDGNLYDHLDDIFGEPLAVPSQNCVYWLRGRFGKTGILCCYDWKTKQIFEGVIKRGFEEDEPICYFFEGCFKPLLHIAGDFFCLVWSLCDINTDIHFSFLIVHKIKSSGDIGSLDIHLIGCQNNVVQGLVKVDQAKLLLQDRNTNGQKQA